MDMCTANVLRSLMLMHVLWSLAKQIAVCSVVSNSFVGMHLSEPATSIDSMAKASTNEGHADGNSRKRKRKRTLIESVNESATEAGNTKFARALASPDYSTREKGLQVLTLWLRRRPNIIDADLSKLWKGLFYAFWHADKADVQVRVHPLLCQEDVMYRRAAAAAEFCVGLAGGTCAATGTDPASAWR
jgi:hypothetical protein